MDGEKAVIEVAKAVDMLELPNFEGKIFKYERKEKTSGE